MIAVLQKGEEVLDLTIEGLKMVVQNLHEKEILRDVHKTYLLILLNIIKLTIYKPFHTFSVNQISLYF